MSPDEQQPLATTSTPTLSLTLRLMLMLLVLSPQPASSYSHAESSAPQLYVKNGDTFVPLDGRFAVVPLENVLERKSPGGRRKECIAACLRDRAPSRTGRSLGFDLETPSSMQDHQQEEGPDCIIKVTQVKVHYGQCNVAGGMFPYCISNGTDGSEAPVVDFFSRDCAFSPMRRINGLVKAASKKESNNPGVFADVETLPELAVAHKWQPSHSVLLTTASEASLTSTTTQAEAAVVDEVSTAARRSAAQT